MVTKGSGVWAMDNVVWGDVRLDFESTTASVPIPDGYGGLEWVASNEAFGSADVFGGNPMRGEVQIFNIASNNEIAWNAGAAKNTVISRDANFDVLTLDLITENDLSPAFLGATQLRISGWDDGVQEHFMDVNLTDTLTTTTLNWTDIDRIDIDVVAGAVNPGTNPTGFWGMDNLIIA
jgi:hypothetical protein